MDNPDNAMLREGHRMRLIFILTYAIAIVVLLMDVLVWRA